MPFIQVKQEIWKYTLSRRAKKYIRISLKGNGEIYVSAPRRVPLYEIENVILEKVDWIRENISKLSPKENEIRDGGVFWYHGISYPVKVKQASQNNITIMDNCMKIEVKQLDDKKIEKLFKTWVYQEATKVYESFVESFVQSLWEYKIEKPDIQIRKMRSRWGSCIPSKKKIVLNIALFYVPTCCMEYVILHELVHLIEPNHGKKFYSVLTKQMPDWKARRDILNKDFGNIL